MMKSTMTVPIFFFSPYSHWTNADRTPIPVYSLPNLQECCSNQAAFISVRINIAA